jgi:hypothetical protein
VAPAGVLEQRALAVIVVALLHSSADGVGADDCFARGAGVRRRERLGDIRIVHSYERR